MTLSKRPTPPVDSSILQIVTEISFSLPPLVHDLHLLVERRERSEGGQGLFDPTLFDPPTTNRDVYGPRLLCFT